MAYGPGGGDRPRGIMSKVVGSLAATFVLGSILLNLYLGLLVFGYTRDVSLNESVYLKGEIEQRVVILPVKGMIDDEMSGFIQGALRELLEAEHTPKALVLRVDSGGGGVAASDQIWHALAQFKAALPEVPIVASFGSVAASGGYYISAHSDAIVAEPTCITGSIGVMAPYMTFEGLMEKIGVTPEVLVATESQDKDVANNVLRSWDERDREKVVQLLDHAHARFVGIVADGRKAHMSEEEAAALATGRVFTATGALESKLIDKIGYLNDAIDEAVTLAGLTKPHVTVIGPRKPLLAQLMGANHTAVPGISSAQVRRLMQEMATPRLEYVAWPIQ